MHSSCQNNNQNKTGEKEVTQMKESSLENAGKAKLPSGIIKYTINGVTTETPKNQNQCMIIGMGNDYGQLMVSGGNKVTIVYVGKLKLGVIEVHKVAGMPDLGLQIIHEGETYNNLKDTNPIVEITKMTQDGNNFYVAGKFSGTIKTSDGKKSITVTDGIFESTYVD